MGQEEVTRRPFAIINLILAIGVAVIGIAVVGIAIAWHQNKFYQSDGDFQEWTQNIFTGMVIIGVTAITASVAGIALIQIKAWPLNFVYGIILTPVWITFAIFGQMISQATKVTTADVYDSCTAKTVPDNQFMTILQDYIQDIDSTLIKTSDKWMCSKQCPCPFSESYPWVNLNQNELFLNGRTNNAKDLNDGDGSVSLWFVQAADYYPDSFYDCYFDWKADWIAAGSKTGVTPATWYSQAQKDFEALVDVEYAFSMTEYLENAQFCTGICTTGLFPFANPVLAKSGSPKQSCFTKIQPELIIGGNFVASWIFAGLGVVLAAWLWHFALYCKFNKD